MVGAPRAWSFWGKDETRKHLLSRRHREQQGWHEEAFAKFLKFGGAKTDTVMVDNAEWLAGLNYIEFLRDVDGTSLSTAC